MRKRITLTVICSVLCVLFGVSLLFLLPDENAGTTDNSKKPLDEMMPIIAFDNVKSVYIKNQNDEYKVINKDDTLVLEGNEQAPLNNYKLMYLLSNACHTYYTYTAEATAAELERFGLAEGEHNAEYTVETLDGKTYTVYIGDETLAEDGYYARVPDKEAVFVLGYDIENDLLGNSEYLINRNLVYPTDMNFYFLADDFVLQKNGEDFVKIGFVDAAERSELAAMGIQRLEYPAGYFASDYYNSILTKFTLLDAEGTTNFMVSEVYSYSVDDTILREYGITPEKPAYLMSFSSPIMDKDGNPVAKFPNVVVFSEKQRDESGAYYYNAYSLYTGILGRVEAITVDFLEWGIEKWVSPYLFQVNIINVDTISYESANGFFEFKLEGDTNEQLTVRETKSGYSPDIKNFRNLWQTMLVITHDGYCDIGDEKLSAVMANERNMLLEMNVVTRSGIKQQYKFWQYTDQRVYYTINGVGEFYLPITMVNKLIADVDRFMNGETIDPEARY